MKNRALLLSMIATLGVTTTACTTTHTETELQAKERQRDATDRSEAERDREIGEEGGINEEEIGEEADRVVRESDL